MLDAHAVDHVVAMGEADKNGAIETRTARVWSGALGVNIGLQWIGLHQRLRQRIPLNMGIEILHRRRRNPKRIKPPARPPSHNLPE